MDVVKVMDRYIASRGDDLPSGDYLRGAATLRPGPLPGVLVGRTELAGDEVSQGEPVCRGAPPPHRGVTDPPRHLCAAAQICASRSQLPTDLRR